jgi:hypothetical protein
MSQDTRHQADWLGGAAIWPPRPGLVGSLLRCLRAVIRELGTR